MTDSDPLEGTLGRDQRERHAFVKEWAAYVRTHPDADWGEQVNRLVDAQLESARHFEDERPNVEVLDSSSIED